MEPYFESQQIIIDGIQYPFSCFISDSEEKNFIVRPHWHYYIEVLFFLCGQAKIFLGGQNYDVKTGDLVLMNAREVHSINVEEGELTQYIVVKFDPEVLYTSTRTIFEAKYIMPFTIANSAHQRVFVKKELINTPIPALMKDLFHEYVHQNYGFELAIRTGISQLFLWVLRNWKKKGFQFEVDSISKENDIKKFQILFDYLDDHYQEVITAEAMAKMCGMSYSYFSRQFKKVMRKTFTDYLNYIRITEAEKLLLTTDMNITEIGLHTGFSNSSYFIKQFKHYKNLTPKQFKNKIME